MPGELYCYYSLNGTADVRIESDGKGRKPLEKQRGKGSVKNLSLFSVLGTQPHK